MTQLKSDIRFGTDGWRGIIAEDFTFENVRRVSKAVAAYLKNYHHSESPLVVIGYDTRFLSSAFAKTCADVLSNAGCKVIFSKDVVSTPAVSASTLALKAGAGIIISASHNPANFNGFKIKTPSGSSAPEAVTKNIEQLLDTELGPQSKVIPADSQDLTKYYFKALRDFIDIGLIKRSHVNVVVDPMYGSANGYVGRLLSGGKNKLASIHNSADPLFGGLHPEPIENYLSDLKKAVRQNGADAGLATDGDGDRIGVIDDKGRYLSPHLVFPLLLYYMCKYKNLKGKVVQAISLGYVSERMAKDFGLEFEEVPIGFKYIAERIINEKILIGGEESGGYGFGGYLPERDGVLNSLLIMEMLASTGKSISTLLKEIEKKYGASAFLRTDFVNPGISKNDFVQKIKSCSPSKISGIKVREIKDYDGVEFILEDDSWILLRPSGTEPVIRVYAEAENIEKTNKIIHWGQKLVMSLRGKGITS